MQPTPLMHPLAAGFTLHPERDDVVLLLHGWTGTPAQLRPLADALDAAGYGVVAPLLAGHGTVVEDLVGTRWRDWVTSALEARGTVGPNQRLHVAGLSMGALIAVLIAATDDIASLTMINAPLRVRDRKLALARFVRGIRFVWRRPEIPHPEGYAAEFHHDYRDNPVGTTAELTDLIAGARRALPRVTAPALVVQSRLDRTVRPESGQLAYDDLAAAATRRLVWLDSSGHVATLDVDRDQLASEVVAHLDAVTGRSGGDG